MKKCCVVVLVVMAAVALSTAAWSADNYGKSIDPKWMDKSESNWGKWGDNDQVGILNGITAQMTLDAISLVKKGKVYDLETIRFKGMPVWPGHSGWDILPYASPHGRQNMAAAGCGGECFDPKYNFYAKGGWLDKDINKYNVGLNSEILIGPLHVGTHIDSLAHLTVGKHNHWYNGFNEAKNWSDYGPMKCDASNIPPIILRGVLLDIPAYKGAKHLKPGEPITPEDVKGCLEWEHVQIKKGDCVLFRTGTGWPDMSRCPGAGPTLETMMWLVNEKGIFLTGDDQAAFENFPPDAPATFPGHVHPCHNFLLIQKGIHLMEMIQMEELSKDKVYEFCLIILPNKIKGATGAMIRPIAVI